MANTPEQTEALSPLDAFLAQLNDEDAADVMNAVASARARSVPDEEIYTALTSEVGAAEPPTGEPEPTA